MFCPNCGAKVDQEHKFCSQCGVQFAQKIRIPPESNAKDIIVKLNKDPLWLHILGGKRPSVFASVLMIIVGFVVCGIGYSIYENSTIQQFLNMRHGEYMELYGHGELTPTQWAMAIGGALVDILGIALFYVGLVACLDKVKPANRQKFILAKIIAIILCAVTFVGEVFVHCIISGNEKWRPSLWDYLILCVICRAIWKGIVGSKHNDQNIDVGNTQSCCRNHIFGCAKFVIVIVIIICATIAILAIFQNDERIMDDHKRTATAQATELWLDDIDEVRKPQKADHMAQSQHIRPYTADHSPSAATYQEQIIINEANGHETLDEKLGREFVGVSDEELARLAAMASEYDFSNMSDEELAKIAAMAPDPIGINDGGEEREGAGKFNFDGVSDEELARLASYAPKESDAPRTDKLSYALTKELGSILDGVDSQVVAKIIEMVKCEGFNSNAIKRSAINIIREMQVEQQHQRYSAFLGWIQITIPKFLCFCIPPSMDLEESLYNNLEFKRGEVVLDIDLFVVPFVARTHQLNLDGAGKNTASFAVKVFPANRRIGNFLNNLTAERLELLNQRAYRQTTQDLMETNGSDNNWSIGTWYPVERVCVEGLNGYKSSFIKQRKHGYAVCVVQYYVACNDNVYEITFTYQDCDKGYWSQQLDLFMRRIKFYR